nr:actin-binding protein wsp1-like [Lolium perenne]
MDLTKRDIPPAMDADIEALLLQSSVLPLLHPKCYSPRCFSLRPVLTSPYLNLSHSVPPCPTAAAVPHLASPPAPQTPPRLRRLNLPADASVRRSTPPASPPPTTPPLTRVAAVAVPVLPRRDTGSPPRPQSLATEF